MHVEVHVIANFVFQLHISCWASNNYISAPSIELWGCAEKPKLNVKALAHQIVCSIRNIWINTHNVVRGNTDVTIIAFFWKTKYWYLHVEWLVTTTIWTKDLVWYDFTTKSHPTCLRIITAPGCRWGFLNTWEWIVHETVPNIERAVHYRQVSPEHLEKAYTSNILKYGTGILPKALNGLQQNYHEHNFSIFIACLQTNGTLTVCSFIRFTHWHDIVKLNLFGYLMDCLGWWVGICQLQKQFSTYLNCLYHL